MEARFIAFHAEDFSRIGTGHVAVAVFPRENAGRAGNREDASRRQSRERPPWPGDPVLERGRLVTVAALKGNSASGLTVSAIRHVDRFVTSHDRRR